MLASGYDPAFVFVPGSPGPMRVLGPLGDQMLATVPVFVGGAAVMGVAVVPRLRCTNWCLGHYL